MKVIHTSDWHLGKTLEGNSRLEEQEEFCEEFVKIVNENNINLIIIAGNIYDRYNPSIEAEKLFYKTVSSLSNNGQRCVLIINGSHDNPRKLEAINPLVKEQGIIISALEDNLTKYKYRGFEVLEANEGYIKLKVNEEIANIITLPYSSNISPEELGNKIRKLENNFNENHINIAVAHILVNGNETIDGRLYAKRRNEFSIDKKDLPNKAQYIALGYLHKAQRASERSNTYYSGSPIQYSKDEKDDIKGAYIVELSVQEKPKIIQARFNNYKPIKVFKCNSINEAFKICEENKEKNIWSYFEIKTDKPILRSDMNQMKKVLNGIIDIKSIITSKHENNSKYIQDKSIAELFKEFYIMANKTEPKGELMDLFLDIVHEEGDMKNETN